MSHGQQTSITTTVSFYVSYNQVAVFDPSLARPFNEWTDKHVRQGFSWRPGSVSFRSLIEAGRHGVEIEIVDRMREVHPDAVRVIEVPFDVPEDGSLEVGSVIETIPLSLPAGPYLCVVSFFVQMPRTGERD